MKSKNNIVYIAILTTSTIYAPLLSWWQKYDPISYHQTIWLQTVIGCGYVLLFLRLIVSPKEWLRVCIGFFFSSIPIVARALISTALQNRQLKEFTRRDE